jgi:pyridoxal phosphate enzyme (YggS family)
MSIAENINRIRKEIPEYVTLIAVSKTKPIPDLLEAYEAGQRHFGENKVQEMVQKWENMPKDIHWHLIGHLQTNKVKYIASFVFMIHAIDSLKLLKEVDKQAAKNGRTIDVLLQFFIANEETKFGMTWDEAFELLRSEEFQAMKNIRIRGVMGMASFTEDEQQIRKEFNTLKNYFREIKENFLSQAEFFDTISMGMSGDYILAIEEGSTMVRVGSSIFGSR